MKITHTEEFALLVAVAALGAKLLAGTSLWAIGVIGGVLVAGVSFAIRKGWQSPPTAVFPPAQPPTAPK